jgi:hypothetical protein
MVSERMILAVLTREIKILIRNSLQSDYFVDQEVDERVVLRGIVEK